MKENKKWVFWFATIVIIVTSIPYLLGFSLQGTDWRFSGFLIGVEDGNSYIAKMLRGANGDWLFFSPYTTVHQNGLFAFLPYILLGKLAAEPGVHLQLVAIFQLLRVIGSFLSIFASYDLICLFIDDEGLRRVSLALITLGGGLGWLLIFFVQANSLLTMPLEFYSPESFGFLEVFGLPHLAISRAFLFWGICQYLGSFESKKPIQNSILGGILWLAAGIFQPLTVATGWILLAIHQLIFWITGWIQNQKVEFTPEQVKWIKSAVLMGLISSPIVLYSLIGSEIEPYFSAWTKQNLILSPSPQYYVFAYLVFLPFAVLQMLNVLKKKSIRESFLAGWVIGFPFMAYAPHNLQRRLPEGIWAAIIILAISYLSQKSWKNSKSLWGMYGISFLSTFLVYFGSLQAVVKLSEPIYIPAAEVRMFQYFSANQLVNQHILADYSIGNNLPAWVPEFVVLGHGPESIDYSKYEDLVNKIWGNEISSHEKKDLLLTNDVDFLIRGPEEEENHLWDPGQTKDFNLVYDQSGYMIYQIDELDHQK